MAALSTSLSSILSAVVGADAHTHSILTPHLWDSVATFGLAGALVASGVVVLALLPWTDQQLSQTDLEARAVLQRASAAVATRRSALAVAVPRSS